MTSQNGLRSKIHVRKVSQKSGGEGGLNYPRKPPRFDGPALCNVFSRKPQRAMPNEHEVSLVQGIIPQ